MIGDKNNHTNCKWKWKINKQQSFNIYAEHISQNKQNLY